MARFLAVIETECLASNDKTKTYERKRDHEGKPGRTNHGGESRPMPVSATRLVNV